MYEVVIASPSEELSRLRGQYRDAATALVNLHIRYTAGTDQLEEVLRELDDVFPRWYARDWKEAGALGPSIARTDDGTTRSFAETVREYLTTELVQHPEGERDAILAIAEGLMKELD
jgi:DNA repair protein SbcD/Mre11